MKRDKSFKVFIVIIIVTILVAVVYGVNRKTDDTFYGGGITASTSNDNCDDVNMLEPDDGYSRPVKGMKYKDSIDSLAFSKHVDLSSIDGDNFYSRDLNPGNRNITPNVISYPIRRNDYYDDAYDDGYSSGHNNGYDEGYEEGYEAAKRELENK